MTAVDLRQDVEDGKMELRGIERPFPHVLAAEVLSAGTEAEVLSRLEEFEWKNWSGEFFRFQVSAVSDQLASLLALPALTNMVCQMKPALERHLKTSLSSDVSCDVHRYDKDSSISFHTDESVRDVRFVLNLNRGWTLSDGGVWALSSEPELASSIFLPPLSNTGFAFAAGRNTFHALSRRSGVPSYGVVTRYPTS